MEALSERGMGKAVGEYVKKDDNEAINTMVNHQIKDLNATLNQVGYYVYWQPGYNTLLDEPTLGTNYFTVWDLVAYIRLVCTTSYLWLQ